MKLSVSESVSEYLRKVNGAPPSLVSREPELEEEPEVETFTDHIRVHGIPRFLSYRGERHDN